MFVFKKAEKDKASTCPCLPAGGTRSQHNKWLFCRAVQADVKEAATYQQVALTAAAMFFFFAAIRAASVRLLGGSHLCCVRVRGRIPMRDDALFCGCRPALISRVRGF